MICLWWIFNILQKNILKFLFNEYFIFIWKKIHHNLKSKKFTKKTYNMKGCLKLFLLHILNIIKFD
jgi:hypothetical protein